SRQAQAVDRPLPAARVCRQPDRHRRASRVHRRQPGTPRRTEGRRRIRGHAMRPRTDHVDPDLPITPMLDMAFQLMAFFLITFRPMPVEGQMALALPAKDGTGVLIQEQLEDVRNQDVTVSIYSGPDGRIRQMNLEDASGTRNLGADEAVFQRTLQEFA